MGFFFFFKSRSFEPESFKVYRARSPVHLSETVVIDEVRSVSVDQGVEGETVLPAVGQKAEALSVQQRGGAVGSLGWDLSTFGLSR